MDEASDKRRVTDGNVVANLVEIPERCEARVPVNETVRQGGRADCERRVPKLDRCAISEESYLSFASSVSGYGKGRSHRNAVSSVHRPILPSFGS